MVRIQFRSIEIDSIENSSSVNKGDNLIVGRRHSSKGNDGFGDISGEGNQAAGNTHLVLDRDRVDAPKPKRKG